MNSDNERQITFHKLTKSSVRNSDFGVLTYYLINLHSLLQSDPSKGENFHLACFKSKVSLILIKEEIDLDLIPKKQSQSPENNNRWFDEKLQLSLDNVAAVLNFIFDFCATPPHYLRTLLTHVKVFHEIQFGTPLIVTPYIYENTYFKDVKASLDSKFPSK